MQYNTPLRFDKPPGREKRAGEGLVADRLVSSIYPGFLPLAKRLCGLPSYLNRMSEVAYNRVP